VPGGVVVGNRAGERKKGGGRRGRWWLEKIEASMGIA